MAKHQYCDGVTRRDALRVGVLGGAGLTLANWMQLAASGAVGKARAQRAIFVNLAGGPSHMDSFDLKPDAPAEYRGEFRPIGTNVSGVEICEHLPKLAGVADKYALVRNISHNIAAHELGQKFLNTGNRPLPSLQYPAYGAVVSKELAADPDLPPFVAIPNTQHSAGYLGVQYNAFQTNTTPRPGAPFSVRGISLAGGLTVSDIERRYNLLGDIDAAFSQLDSSDLVGGLDKFSQQAYAMITSQKTRRAFDIGSEPVAVSDRFGATAFGQSCLLAVRLVEAGVRFVTINNGGWDTHQTNFVRLKDTLLPPLDTGVAAMLTALDERGLLDSTLVVVTGEFGRTPKVNARGGRDHWARAMSVLIAGGGVRGGQVVGATDDRGTAPASRALPPENLAATMYYLLGIDHRKEYHTNTGRPVMIVREGEPISELVS